MATAHCRAKVPVHLGKGQFHGGGFENGVLILKYIPLR